MRHSLATVAILLSVVCILPAQCQPAAPAPPAPPPSADATAALSRDVDALLIIRTLKMTPQQAAAAVPILTTLQVSLGQYRQTADALWAQSGPSINSVYQSWAAGNAADPTTQAAADKAINDLNAARDATRQAVEQAATQVRGLLERSQTSLIETAQAEQMRRTAEAALGAPSLADYIARRIATLRSLMPDEYDATRLLEAQGIAAKMVDPRGRNFDATTGRVLDVLDRAMDWNDAQFQANRPRLGTLVAQALNLPGAEGYAIKYGEFSAFLSDPASIVLLTAVSGGAAPPNAPPPPAPKKPEIETANELARNLITLNALNVAPQQLAQIIPVTANIAAGLQAYETSCKARRMQSQQELTTARQEMLAGQPLDEVTNATLQMIRASDGKAKQEQMLSAADALASVRRVLTVRQNALIDWRVPEQYSGAEDARVEIADAKRIAATMHSTVEFLENVRYAQVDVYLATRTNKIEEYLRRYVDPQSNNWPRYRQFLFDITDEAKVVKENQWKAAAPGFAARILRALGIVHQGNVGGERGADYNWQAMYDLFSHPQTGELLKYMLQARAGNR